MQRCKIWCNHSEKEIEKLNIKCANHTPLNSSMETDLEKHSVRKILLSYELPLKYILTLCLKHYRLCFLGIFNCRPRQELVIHVFSIEARPGMANSLRKLEKIQKLGG